MVMVEVGVLYAGRLGRAPSNGGFLSEEDF